MSELSRYPGRPGHLPGQMTFSNSVRSGFRNFVNFHGRAGRGEFWYWTLFTILASIVFGSFSAAIVESAVGGFVALALMIPSLAVAVRRLHDTGKSAGWLLWNLVPVLGQFVFLGAMLQGSTPGDNRFGPNPLGMEADYYQAQQYLPGARRGQLPAPQYGGPLGVNLAMGGAPAEERLDPVTARRTAEQDAWAAQFNNLQSKARLDVPSMYKQHHFTDDELAVLRAGRPKTVALTDDNGDIYFAQVKWVGSRFTEVRTG